MIDDRKRSYCSSHIYMNANEIYVYDMSNIKADAAFFLNLELHADMLLLFHW